jgi:asparagine synthase (glutamine-hydrolysing)
MAGVAGIARAGKRELVAKMLERIAHRGRAGSKITEGNGTTLGVVWPEAQASLASSILRWQAVWDGSHPPSPDPAVLRRARGPFALAAATPKGLFLARDPLGIRPLYYGRTENGTLCFASEVKALTEVTRDIQEFPPGSRYDNDNGFQTYFELGEHPVLTQSDGQIASELRLRLEQAVRRQVDSDVMGCWLSGRLGSSGIAALARPHVRELHTVSADLLGTPERKSAYQVAAFLNAEHHEVYVTLVDILAVLPEVIYHLESFDGPLVRSAVIHYLVSQRAADTVGSVFYGEGADELFAGRAYFEKVKSDRPTDEPLHIALGLHNTSLQRVDRSASAHGLVAHLPFLDLDVVEYAMRIPMRLKLMMLERKTIGKWILRRALIGVLPSKVLGRAKAVRWRGAEVEVLLAQYAEGQISDGEFQRERTLPNGWLLNTKEELMYYRIFEQHFGDLDDLAWMGWTTAGVCRDRCEECVGYQCKS